MAKIKANSGTYISSCTYVKCHPVCYLNCKLHSITLHETRIENVHKYMTRVTTSTEVKWVVFLTVTWNTISITRVSFRTPFSNKRRKLNNKISWPFWSAWFQYRKIWIISAIDHTFYGFTGVVLRRVIFKLFECWQRSPNMPRGLSWRR